MDDARDFEYINNSYRHTFGISQLDVFFDERPGGSAVWLRLKRWLVYFFIFFFYPLWLVIEVSGLLYSNKRDLQPMAFGVGYGTYILQTTFKTYYYITNIGGFRSLCLEFNAFHSFEHRPVFSKMILSDMSTFLRKLIKISYSLMYINCLSWNLQLIFQPMFGFMERRPCDYLIPKLMPITYPFDETSTTNRLIIILLETVVLNAGIIHALPVDLFVMSIFMMICAQMDVICMSVQTAEELSTAIGKNYSELFGAEDDRDRMDIRLFIEDHQTILRITKKVRKIISPVLGYTITYFIVMVATLALTVTSEIKSAGTFSRSLWETTRMLLGMTSVLTTLFMYSWICGRLKESEETFSDAVYSTNWYERDKKYRDAILIIMGQSIRSRPLRMFSSGNMGRQTFLQGLKGIYSYYNFLIGFQ